MGMGWALPAGGFAFVAVASVAAVLLFTRQGAANSPEALVSKPTQGGAKAGKPTLQNTPHIPAIQTLPRITTARTTERMRASTTKRTRATTEAMTKKMTTTLRTTAKATTTTTTPATTEHTTTTTTTMTPMWKKPLLCSFEATLNPSLRFPEDGLCDISFFQALEKNHTFLKGKGGQYDAALNAFLTNAAKQKKTEHGVSLDYNYNGATMNNLKDPAVKKTIEELWAKKIYHWAYLNVEVYDLNADNMTHLFEILKEIKWMIDQTIKPSRPHYVVYTGSLSSPYRSFIETNAIKNVLWIDGLAVYTHFIDDDRRWTSGRMIPPTFWARPKSVEDKAVYTYNMGTAHKGLKSIADKQLNHTAFYFTISMAGRRYIPEKEYAYLATMEASPEKLFVDVTAYCKNDKYKYGFEDKEVIGAYYKSKEEKQFITFDDSKALSIKFCEGKKSLIDVSYGFLVYNVEMDDPTNKCGKGAYQRVKFLRRLVKFFRNNFTTPGSFKQCLKLT